MEKKKKENCSLSSLDLFFSHFWKHFFWSVIWSVIQSGPIQILSTPIVGGYKLSELLSGRGSSAVAVVNVAT